MKMIPTRELAANSGKVMEELAVEGVLVITKDGKPRSIMVPTSDETLFEDLRSFLYTRAARKLAEVQMSSVERGLDQLTDEEIEKEIAAVRGR